MTVSPINGKGVLHPFEANIYDRQAPRRKQEVQRGIFRENLDHYKELARGQNPSVLWIGCSDSRIQTGNITQTMPGTLFVHRNVGNIVPLHDLEFCISPRVCLFIIVGVKEIVIWRAFRLRSD